MQSQLSESEQAFADQVEQFIAQNWLNIAEPRRRMRAWLNTGDTEPLRKRWYYSVVAAGWSVPHWPEEFGGCDWSPQQLHIWLSACLKHQTPAVLTFATAHVGPLLIEYGDTAQRALLAQIAAFEETWCLGWAEQDSLSDHLGVATRVSRTPRQLSIRGTKTRVIEGMQAHWMMCIARAEDSQAQEPSGSVVLLPLQQSRITRSPQAALSSGQPMAEIVITEALAPPWGELHIPISELHKRLSGITAGDLSISVDGAALMQQAQGLANRLRGEPNMELGLLRDCDELAIEILALQGMEQRAIVDSELPPTLLRLRAQTLWGKLSELQIAAFGYYALPFVDGALADNEGPVDNTRPLGEMDMTMVMRRMLSPTIATELGLDPRDSLAQDALGLPAQDH